MQAVVSLLDGELYERYESLMHQMTRELGLEVKYARVMPHFSYHVAERYEAEPLIESLREMAWQTESFSVRVSGLGIFTVDPPVVYASIVRTRPLSKWHEKIWEAAEPVSGVTNVHYQKNNWVPHITLTNGLIMPERLPEVIEWLRHHDFRHDVLVNNIAYITEVEETDPIRFDFAR